MSHTPKAQLILDRVIQSGIRQSKGTMTFTLGKLSIELDSMDIVGGAIQDWFGEWLKKENIEYTKPSNTQSFPDFILDQNDYLEIKCFNFTAGPAFDIANYGAYIESLLLHPERLDASYLIFAYSMTNKVVKIEEIWLKNIWEIAGTSQTNILEIQKKRDEPVNIRPKKWYVENNKNFKSKFEFIEALHESALHFSYPRSHTEKWLETLIDRYIEKTGNPI